MNAPCYSTTEGRLKKGGIYLLQANQPLRLDDYLSISRTLDSIFDDAGVRFILLPDYVHKVTLRQLWRMVRQTEGKA
mgnify:FL=1